MRLRAPAALAAVALLAGSQGLDARLLLVLAVMLGAAKLFGDLFERVGMPPVLGELTAGIVIGNLDLVGWHVFDFALGDANLAFLAELGVILLLFQVGVESNLAAMARVGVAALVVACVGVILPMGLGYGLHALLAPERTWHAHLFIGAVLSATSVGITARVFKDLGRIDSPTGRVVLGAAVIDDVLGLIVLAVVSGLVHGANSGDSLDTLAVLLIIGKAVGFLAVAIAIGPWVSRHLYTAASVLRVHGVLLATSLCVCFAAAYGAHAVGLAPIVGAFAAGLILDELTFHDHLAKGDRPLEAQLEPLGQFLTPVFFVLTGAHVDLGAFGDSEALAMAGALTLAAIAGKQACALVAYGPGVHKLSVGLGMIPRGEVGLIFAATGASLLLAGEPVISQQTYAAIVLMVMITTMVTPPLLAWSLRRAPAITAASLVLLLACGGNGASAATPRGPVAPSASAIELTLPALDGGEVSLASHRGKVVVLHVFTTWSLDALADNDALAAADADPDVVVIGIALDQEGHALVSPWRSGAGVRYLVALADDTVRTGASPLGPLPAVPVTLVIDRRGRAHQRIDRPLQGDELSEIVAAAADAE